MLLALKWAKIRSSPFAFLRGTAPLFYQNWTHRTHPPAPLVWMCGDAHLENAGSYKGEDGISYFDLNDFDEAALAPVHFELGRALTGLYLLRKPQLAPDFLAAYLAALGTGKPRHIEPDVATGPIAKLLASVQARTVQQFLAARTENGKLKLREGHAFPLEKKVKQRVQRTFAHWAKTQPNPAFFTILDTCGRIAGNGSLGLERYMFLVKGNKHPGIIDMKQAASSAANRFLRTKQPLWTCEAERVASLQYFLQYVPPAHLGWIDAGSNSYIFRKLQPNEDRVDSTKLSQDDFNNFIHQWAKLIASAHLRSAGWRGSASLDALMEFGHNLKPKTQGRLLSAAQRSAQAQFVAFALFRKQGPLTRR